MSLSEQEKVNEGRSLSDCAKKAIKEAHDEGRIATAENGKCSGCDTSIIGDAHNFCVECGCTFVPENDKRLE